MSFQPAKFDIKEARKYNHDADGIIGDEAPASESGKSKKGKQEKKLIEELPDEPVTKKAKVDKSNGIKPIEQIVKAAIEEDVEELDGEEDEDEESSDVDMDEWPEDETKEVSKKEKNQDTATTTLPATSRKTNGVQKDANGDDISETIDTVSEDTADSAPSPTQQEINWQSKIEGNTKVAKKARKKERHARRLALSEERSAGRQKERARLARRLDRKERRQKRAEQIERREEREEKKFGDYAKIAGLTIKRYKRKLERGEIKFEADGKPVAISKKDIKKARREAEKAQAREDDGSSKKRKRDAGLDDSVEKSEKKKKKKSKGLEA